MKRKIRRNKNMGLKEGELKKSHGVGKLLPTHKKGNNKIGG